METIVKERPILMSAPMVRAILDGRKTQTRRVIKPQPTWKPDILCVGLGDRGPGVLAYQEGPGIWHHYGSKNFCEAFCPYGKLGDRLWVREAWRAAKGLDAFSGKAIGEKALAAGHKTPWAPLTYLADGHIMNGEVMRSGVGEFGADFGRYRHARFMPRWASRITLELTDVRVQRLQDISEEDAKAEGAEWYGEADLDPRGEAREGVSHAYRAGFQDLWQAINGESSWAANPWVWAVSFKRVEVQR